MNIEEAAKALKELGHPSRLAIYKRLVRGGSKGVAVGTIQDELDIPGSTLSHHLSSLTSAGLIHQRREGRTLFCVAQFEQLDLVITFLQDECCTD
ncbi:metalloregulator ArsR/SmtB family transcription factor [uncultured Umboniibacter sp.]|uniref:ArsR/SmtB family transcription factor n=1 Tax=uncultured Umboniibacter sp. TaxID=1798917 RepID=UPI00260EF80D|nr:metalloregulator ArsR/SmtB family transcription factor [uncultured Umboniibacter sp.]